jgi:putative hemolysin
VNLLLLIVLLILSAAFSGSETAYFSLRPTDLARLSRRNDRAGRRVVALMARTRSLLSALLIGNLLVNTAASVVITSLCLAWFGPRGIVLAVPLATLALLLLGEITPKMLALRWRRGVATLVQAPLTFWVMVTRPLQLLTGWFVSAVLRLLPLERTGSGALSTEELQTACDLAVEDGALSETEGRFLARLLRLRDLDVREVMIPRPEVVTIDRDSTRRQIMATARATGRSRFPVIVEGKSQPVGLFHVKDLIEDMRSTEALAGSMRPLVFVPESKDVAALVAEMRTGATHLAAVVDEHGDFAGVVTLTDCLRALMGPVGDTTTSIDHEVVAIGAGRWVVAGRLDPRALHENIGVELPSSHDYVTVAGFLMAQLGRIPRPGDVVVWHDARLTVLEMSGHRIDRILVMVPGALDEEQA